MEGSCFFYSLFTFFFPACAHSRIEYQWEALAFPPPFFSRLCSKIEGSGRLLLFLFLFYSFFPPLVLIQGYRAYSNWAENGVSENGAKAGARFLKPSS